MKKKEIENKREREKREREKRKKSKALESVMSDVIKIHLKEGL